MPSINVGDRVNVIDDKGDLIGEGTIANINELREPKFMYAVDADFFDEDFIFLGKENLVKIQEEN